MSIAELNANMEPTGRIFNTQINDNKGSFEFKNIVLNSNYVQLIANGYYFNEITGTVSISQLTLHALSDLSDSSSVNVNILTELEKNRVEFLVGHGKTFKEAKSQAQIEVLKLFSLSDVAIKSSEYLDISKVGTDNAILLTISIIMQGYRTEAELSELIANLSSDIREDGTLDNLLLGQKLINDIKLVDLSIIRANIVKRYQDLGVSMAIPDFENATNQFINNTKYLFSNNIEYSVNGTYGPNILSKDQLLYPSRTTDNLVCSITAKLPRGSSLKVIFKPDMILATKVAVADTSGGNPLPVGSYSDYAFYSKENSGWSYNNDSYPINHSTIFFNSEADRLLETQFDLNWHGGAKIEIYENNQLIPARIKHISW